MSIVKPGLKWSLAIVTVVVACHSPASAQDPGFVARNTCENVVTNQLRAQYGAGRVGFNGARLNQVSNAETGVSGTGQFEQGSFSYRCIYNIRNGQTYGIDVNARVAGNPSYNSGGYNAGNNHMSAGQAAGAIIGLAIAGAVIDSIDKKHHRPPAQPQRADWWSPAPDVQCSSTQNACYYKGRFSPKFTSRVFN